MSSSDSLSDPFFLQSLQQLGMLSALVVKFSSAETFLLSASSFFFLAWIGIILFGVKIIFPAGFHKGFDCLIIVVEYILYSWIISANLMHQLSLENGR